MFGEAENRFSLSLVAPSKGRRPRNKFPSQSPITITSLSKSLIVVWTFLTIMGTHVSQSQSIWVRVNPVFNGVTSGDGKTVAVGAAGAAWVSEQDGTWVKGNVGKSTDLHGVCYSPGLFVAVGTLTTLGPWDRLGRTTNTTGVIFYSSDARTWRQPFQSPLSRPSRIIFGNGRFVAVGSSVDTNVAAQGTSWTSTDGITWTQHEGISDQSIRDIAFGKDQFTAITENQFLGSGDGETWQTVASLPAYSFRGLAYGAGNWVAVGDGVAAVSTNGVFWETVPLDEGAQPTSVAYGDGGFVTVGRGGLAMRSGDGRAWTKINADAESDLRCVTVARGAFVAAGDAALLLRSADHASWITENEAVDGFLVDIAYGEGLFVSVGRRGAIWASRDGEQWARQQSPTTNDLAAVAYGAGRFIAVGSNSALLISEDGSTWKQRDCGLVADLTSVAWGKKNNFIVGTGDGKVTTSKDGDYWNSIYESYEPVPVPAVCASDNLMMVVLKTSSIQTNLHGPPFDDLVFSRENWDGFEAWRSPTGGPWGTSTAVYCDGHNFYIGALPWYEFVYVPGEGLERIRPFIMSSNDGVSWDEHYALCFTPADLLMGEAVSIIVGPTIAYRYRNSDWLEFEIGSPDAPLSGIARGRNVIVAVGSGSIWTSETDLRLHISPQQDTPGFEIELTGCVDRFCDIQASSNLVDWKTLFLLEPSQDPVRLVDSSKPSLARFYRVVVREPGVEKVR